MPRTASQKQERRTAKRYGGQVNSGSGNGWARKSDVRTPTKLFENKTTADRKQITIKAADLEGAVVHALADNRDPVLQFDLNRRSYVIIPEDDYFEGRL